MIRKISYKIGRLIIYLIIVTGLILPDNSVFRVNAAGITDISKGKLSEKYSQAAKIKQKYKLDKATLKIEAKDKNSIKVELGEKNQTEFVPNLTLTRWEDEVSVKIKPKGLDVVATKDKTLNFESNKIKFGTPKVEYNLYDLPASTDNPEGGYEFLAILKEKPKTNKIEFTLDTKGLDFFYQPPLTQRYKNGYSEEFQREIVVSETEVRDLDGFLLVSTAENAVGSYAVYMLKPGTNWVGGKVYRTGQFGMIYRPKIIDSAGTEVWGILHIDKITGILSVEIPQDFLDKAVYPVLVDPTIGYTTAGTTNSWIAGGSILHGVIGTTDASGGNVSSITIATLTDTVNFKGVITDSSKVIIANGVSDAGITGGADTWYTANYTTRPTLSASTNYYVWHVESGGCHIRSTYQFGATWGQTDSTNSYTTPTDPTDATTSTNKWSVYATYTPPVAATTVQRLVKLMGRILRIKGRILRIR